MITYKIIEKEKAGKKENYTVYNVYRQIFGIKFWVKSSEQYIIYFILCLCSTLPSIFFSCGCSDFQTFSFFKVYILLFLIISGVFLFIKKDFSSYDKAEKHIKNIIRRIAKKNSKEVANFTFNNDASNISKIYNRNE